MRITKCLLSCLAVWALTSMPVHAERVPLTPLEKKSEATHIVTGEVKALYSWNKETNLYGPGTILTQFLIEIEVQSVEKGEGLKAGELVYVRSWRLKRIGANGWSRDTDGTIRVTAVGPNGHFVIPQKGERIRAFLAYGEYAATAQTDNAYAVVYPNGIDVLDNPRISGYERMSRPTVLAGSAYLGLLTLICIVALAVAAYRRPSIGVFVLLAGMLCFATRNAVLQLFLWTDLESSSPPRILGCLGAVGWLLIVVYCVSLMGSRPATSDTARRLRKYPGGIYLLVGGFAFIDFLGPIMIAGSEPRYESFIMSVFFGAFAAQSGLLAIWAVFGPLRYYLRLPLTLLLGVSLIALAFIGTCIINQINLGSYLTTSANDPPSAYPWEAVLPYLLVIPIVFLAFQAPLWLLRFATGFRINPGNRNAKLSSNTGQFRIQDLFGAMAIVTVSLALLWFAYDGETGLFSGELTWVTWRFVLVCCLVLGVWSLLAAVPCVWAVMLAKNSAVGITLLAGYAAVATLAGAAIIGAIRDDFAQSLLHLGCFSFSSVAMMACSLMLVRAGGYAMNRRVSKTQPSQPLQPILAPR